MGYRLPPQTRLGRVVLQVGNLSRSLAFYCELLGFQVLDEGGAQASLNTSGDEEPLIVLQERAGHPAEQMKEDGVVKDPWGTQLRIWQG